MRTTILVFMLMSIVTLTACADDPRTQGEGISDHGQQTAKGGRSDDLLGTWYVMQSVGDSFHFGDDGTITIRDSPKVLSGQFRKTGPKQVLITLSDGTRTEEVTMDYQIDDDKLVLSQNGAQAVRLTRNPNHGITPESQAISQVSEGLNLAGGAKAAVAEFYMDKRRLPKDNEEAGLARPEQIRGRYVRLVRVENGVVYVTFGASDGTVSKAIDGKSILLELVTSNGGTIEWNCRSENIENENLPPACRQ